MRRDVRLRALSRDHHHALVLARFIEAMCARGGMGADVVALVKERFAAQITPHFVAEEKLLSALERFGGAELVKRTRDEHAGMVRLLEMAGPTDASALCELARLLTAHVRFEERELYVACEERLPAAVLDRVAHAYEEGE